MKHAFIDHERFNHQITTLCRVLQVSKAGFYDWRERHRDSPPDSLTLDTAAHERGRHTYGPKRLRSELIEAGYAMSLSAVKRLRKRLGLRCKQRRQYKATTDSKHNFPVAPNVLNRRLVHG